MRSLRLQLWLALLALTPFVVHAQAGAFGSAVVVGDGEVIVAEPNNNYRPGTVYVYRKANGAWREAAHLRAPNAERADGFGTALARSGNTLFIAQRDGRVHVFRKSGNTWGASGTLTAEGVTREPLRYCARG